MATSPNKYYCTVCKRELDIPRAFEGRNYCAEHFGLFWDSNTPVWRATTLTIVLMVLMALATALGSQLTTSVSGLIHIGFSVILSLLPAGLWLLFVYRSADRLEQSLPLIFPVLFALAILLGAAIVRPLVFEVFNIDEWLAGTSPSNRFLGNILLRGFLHAFLIYALVRYTVWRSLAFQRRTDGILYALSVGWGYTAVMTLLFGLSQPSLLVLNGGLRLLALLCAYVTPSIIIGYFLSRNRFEDMPFFYLPLGVTLAATVCGGLLYAGAELNNTRVNLVTDGFSPWPGLVVSYIILIATFVIIYALITRQNALTRARMMNRSDATL